MKKVTIKVNPIWEATKEPLRLLVLALIPFGMAYLTEFPYGWAIVATVILRWLDKILHELGKSTASEGLTKGLTRF